MIFISSDKDVCDFLL